MMNQFMRWSMRRLIGVLVVLGGLDVVGSSLNGGGAGGGCQAIFDERSSTMSAVALGTMTLALVRQVQVLWLHLGTTCVLVVAGMLTMLLGGGSGDGYQRLQ